MTVTHGLVKILVLYILTLFLPTMEEEKKESYTGVCCLPNLVAKCPPTVLFFFALRLCCTLSDQIKR